MYQDTWFTVTCGFSKMDWKDSTVIGKVWICTCTCMDGSTSNTDYGNNVVLRREGGTLRRSLSHLVGVREYHQPLLCPHQLQSDSVLTYTRWPLNQNQCRLYVYHLILWPRGISLYPKISRNAQANHTTNKIDQVFLTVLQQYGDNITPPMESSYRERGIPMQVPSIDIKSPASQDVQEGGVGRLEVAAGVGC